MAGRNANKLSGILNLHKPGGMTSRDVVDLISRPLRKQAKVGHAGTLDPLASGVLVVAVGRATRLIEYLQRMGKTYRTVIRLGARSDTLDADGQVETVLNPPIPNLDQIRPILATQVGTIQQLPPQFSALKVAGQRAYDLARTGQNVPLEPRPVRIDRVELVSYNWPKLELEVDCGAGTYIRSIARDVGDALGSGGLIEVLIRTRIGGFTLENAVDPTQLEIDALLDHLQPIETAVSGLPSLTLTATQTLAILQGKSLRAADVTGAEGLTGELALLEPEGSLLAIAEMAGESSLVQPRKVLAGPD